MAPDFVFLIGAVSSAPWGRTDSQHFGNMTNSQHFGRRTDYQHLEVGQTLNSNTLGRTELQRLGVGPTLNTWEYERL